MQNLPKQKPGEMTRSSSGPRSVDHIPSSKLHYQMRPPLTQHIASHIKTENMNDKTIDNIYANTASAHNIRHQGNISIDVNTTRPIPTFNSSSINSLSIPYQGNSRNLVNGTSSNLLGNINTGSNRPQQHADTISNRDTGYYQYPVQHGSDRYPVMKGYHLRGPQNEGRSTFNYGENSINLDSNKNGNYDDTSSSE